MRLQTQPGVLPDHWPLQPGDPLPAPAPDVALDLTQWLGDWVALAVAVPAAIQVDWPTNHVRLSVYLTGQTPAAGAEHAFLDASGATAQRWGAGQTTGPQYPLLLTLDPGGTVRSWQRLG